MTERAKRLGKYLQDKYGWEIHDNKRICKCGGIDYQEEHKYCSMCGAKLGKCKPEKDTFIELEDAIKYALQESGLKKEKGKRQ